MKIYSKLLGKIRKNKTRVKKAVGIVTIAVGFRYGRINSISTNLSSNSTQQVEQVHNYVEEGMQGINADGKVKDALSHKSSGHLIKTGSGILIGNQQISEGSKSALRIRSGDLGKSGPGARAKADAARNARKGSIVVEALSPHNIYCRYHQSCAPKSRLGPLFGRSNTPSLSREERRELNRQRTQPKIFDKNITIVSQDLQLTTPVDLSQEVSISDLKQTGKSQRKLQFLKKTLAKKYSKHRKEFQNPDNSPIISKSQFFDAQVRHFQDSKVVRIRSIYLSKDHDPFDCSFYLNPETNQLISVREQDEYGNYVGPRILGEAEADRLLKHGVVGQDQARFKDISWIKHGMTAEDLMTHYNFSKKGKLTDDVMDSVEVAKQFSEIMKNQCSPSDD